MKTIVWTNRAGESFTIILDDDDYLANNQFNWSVDNGYALRAAPKGNKRIYLHRIIVSAKPGQFVVSKKFYGRFARPNNQIGKM